MAAAVRRAVGRSSVVGIWLRLRSEGFPRVLPRQCCKLRQPRLVPKVMHAQAMRPKRFRPPAGSAQRGADAPAGVQLEAVAELS